MAEFLHVEQSEHIATVTLDRAPVNALNRQLLAEISETFGSVASDWDVRAVVFASGQEHVFCGGADLKGMGPEPAPPPTDPQRHARDAMWAILDCPVPVIAAVNGPALGGGLAIAACCDVIVASERAEFGCPEISVGLLGAGSHLQRMVGPYRMRELYFTARRVAAREMLEMGGLSRVVGHDALAGAARQIAADIAVKSPAAIRLAKEALNRVESMPLKEAYRTEQDYTARLGRYQDSKEARAAFLEKRAPRFVGR
ncbi:MAG: enoyl-CoA hydratase-related protein [Myxococcota bacterium]|nr:enoyl-CoA hydratase-related protein [Myxococcota bacterium]